MIFLRPESFIYLTTDDQRHSEMDRIRREMVKSNEKLDALIDVRDRVDISLKEYEELKRVNKDLLDRLRHAECILSKLGVAADVISLVDPDSIKIYYADSFEHSPLIRKRRYRIEFDLEEY